LSPLRPAGNGLAWCKSTLNSGKMSGAKFDQFVSLLQSFHSVGPKRFEPGKQRAVRTISSPNPNQANRIGAQEPAVNEILVLADDDSALASGALPNHRVIGGFQTDLEDMRRLG